MLFFLGFHASALPAYAQQGGGRAGGSEEVDPWAGVEVLVVEGSGGNVLADIAKSASVVAFDSTELVAQGTKSITDLATFTPNLSIVSPSATTATLFIRGVGLQDFSATASSAVAVYQDGVAINSPPLQISQMFDVDNVGILRGPQGIGLNRNASAGAIKIASKKPTFDGLGAEVRLTGGRFVSSDAIDAPLQDYEGGINIPIVDEILTSRLSFRLSQSRGFFTNRCGRGVDPGPAVSFCGEGPAAGFALQPGLSEQVGDRFNWAGRTQLLFVPPTELDMEFLLNVHGSRRDEDSQFGQAVGTGLGGRNFGGPVDVGEAGGIRGYQEPDTLREREFFESRIRAANPTLSIGEVAALAREKFIDNFTRTRPLDINPFDGDFNKEGKITFSSIGGSLQSRIDFEGFRLELTTGVERFDTNEDNDTDFTPDVLFEVDTRNRGFQATQDLLLSGELDDYGISWEAGGFFLQEDLEVNVDTNLAGPSDVKRNARQDILSFGAFGSFEWNFLEAFTLTAGVRYNVETRKFAIFESTPLGPTFTARAFALQTDTYKEPTGTIELGYDMTENIYVYGKFNHGFKPGNFNSNGVESSFVPPSRVREPAEKETIDAFELGLKSSFWAGRINADAAFFHYNYKDYQVFLFEDTPLGPPTLEVINAESARVFGAETELRFTPLEGFVPPEVENLRITLRASWLESEFLDFQNTTLGVRGNQLLELTTDFTGNQLPNSPEFQVSGSVSWGFDLGRFGKIEPRYDFSWTDDTFFDPSEGVGPERFAGGTLPEFTLGQRAFTLHNIRLSYTLPSSDDARGGIEVAGWCRNLTDERYKNFTFNVSEFRSAIINFVGDPRSCGADVSLTW